MKVKTTFYEIYTRISDLRKTRDIHARILADSLVDGSQKSVEHFTLKYQHYNDLIEYLSEIEVEYEENYKSEEQ